jgi:hypothetical protein
LPDGLFSNKNPKLGKLRRALERLENVDILEYWNIWNIGVFFPNIWDILWPFGTFCGHLVYFSRFGMLYQEKSGNPG